MTDPTTLPPTPSRVTAPPASLARWVQIQEEDELLARIEADLAARITR